MNSFDPERFQGEVMKWTAYNFPRAQAVEPLLGIIEEIGELHDVLLLRPVTETARKQWPGAIDDAVGDVMVFLAHYCGMSGYDFLQCVEAYGIDGGGAFFMTPIDELVSLGGKIAHAHLKSTQGIRGNKHQENEKRYVGQMVRCLRAICKLQHADLTEITSHVWGEVKRRDWVKFPKDGGYLPKPYKRPEIEEVPF